MSITLKNFESKRMLNGASTNYKADILFNGEKVGTIRNSGHGESKLLFDETTTKSTIQKVKKFASGAILFDLDLEPIRNSSGGLVKAESVNEFCDHLAENESIRNVFFNKMKGENLLFETESFKIVKVNKGVAPDKLDEFLLENPDKILISPRRTNLGAAIFYVSFENKNSPLRTRIRKSSNVVQDFEKWERELYLPSNLKKIPEQIIDSVTLESDPKTHQKPKGQYQDSATINVQIIISDSRDPSKSRIINASIKNPQYFDINNNSSELIDAIYNECHISSDFTTNFDLREAENLINPDNPPSKKPSKIR